MMKVHLHTQEVRMIISELLKAQQHLIRFQAEDEEIDKSVEHLCEIIQLFQRFDE